jgi:hypothetical protein
LIHKIAQVGLDIKHDVAIELVIKQALKEGLLSQRRIYCYFDADFVPQKTGSIKPLF